jgi:hypothetical protein
MAGGIPNAPATMFTMTCRPCVCGLHGVRHPSVELDYRVRLRVGVLQQLRDERLSAHPVTIEVGGHAGGHPAAATNGITNHSRAHRRTRGPWHRRAHAARVRGPFGLGRTCRRQPPLAMNPDGIRGRPKECSPRPSSSSVTSLRGMSHLLLQKRRDCKFRVRHCLARRSYAD